MRRVRPVCTMGARKGFGSAVRGLIRAGLAAGFDKAGTKSGPELGGRKRWGLPGARRACLAKLCAGGLCRKGSGGSSRGLVRGRHGPQAGNRDEAACLLDGGTKPATPCALRPAPRRAATRRRRASAEARPRAPERGVKDAGGRAGARALADACPPRAGRASAANQQPCPAIPPYQARWSSVRH